MSTVFYRKYRPQSFSEVSGQQHIIDIISEQVSSNTTSHAYLFCGPRGTGKTTTARLLAKAVNCEKFDGYKDICNECDSCNAINSGRAIDILEIDAASNRGIDEIRSLKESIHFMPSSLRKKIYIIDEVHMLTEQAFNALLKTLEEPPEHVLFIMATTEPHKVPVTILSRVQRYDFQLADKKELIKKLTFITKSEGIEVDEEVFEAIYNHTEGSFRDAESLLSKLNQNNSKRITFVDVKKTLGLVSTDSFDTLLKNLLEKNIVEVKKALESMYVESNNIKVLLDQFLQYLTNLLIESAENSVKSKRIYELIEVFLQAKKDLSYFVNQKSRLDFAIMQICLDKVESSASNISSPTVEQAVVKPKKPTEDKFEMQKVEVPQNETDTKTDTHIEGIDYIEIVKNKDRRAYSILKMSSVNQTDNVVKITNAYQFNISYLQKPEITKIILDAYQEVHNISPHLKFEKRQHTTEQPRIDKTNEKEEETSSNNATSFDNSELVEEVFNLKK